jgi:hypothetical protein
MMGAVAGSRRLEILLLLASTALALLLTEAAVRLLGLTERRPSGYAPVNTGRRSLKEKNTRGYRDLERALAKPPGARRLLSLGDSFAWGASVEFADAYPQRLERALNRRRPETWEVVNLALPGMKTADHAAQLADEGFAYQPDVVLLGYVLNDSEDPAARESQRAAEWSEARGPSPNLLDRSALLRLLRGRIWATLENRRRISGYLSMYDQNAAGWIAGQAALRKMGRLCREQGVPWVVAIFPLFGNPLDEGYPFDEIHQKVSHAASAAGAKVVDLLAVYRGLRWDLLVVDGVDDEHPNEIAHRIAAGALLRELDAVGSWPKTGAEGPDAEDDMPSPTPSGPPPGAGPR